MIIGILPYMHTTKVPIRLCIVQSDMYLCCFAAAIKFLDPRLQQDCVAEQAGLILQVANPLMMCFIGMQHSHNRLIQKELVQRIWLEPNIHVSEFQCLKN